MRVLACFFSIAISLCATASAWWDGGHKIVAQIAYEELSVAERRWVMDLLERNPLNDELFVQKLSAELGPSVDEETKMRWYFSQAAVWADLVRDKKISPMGTAIVATYNRDARHYTDAPFFPRPSDLQALPQHAARPDITWEPGRIEPLAELNSLQTLAKARAEIPDTNLPASDRAIDLLWLFHLAGDMHQPCHCVALFSSPALPAGDRGANQIFVFGLQSQAYGMRSDALHAFWDSLFNGETNTHADILARTASAKALTPLWTIARERARISDPTVWWEEGVALAKSEVYKPLLDRIVRATAVPHPAGGDRPDIIQINLPQAQMDAYVLNARRVGQGQIITAGLRLAATLKELYVAAAGAQ